MIPGSRQDQQVHGRIQKTSGGGRGEGLRCRGYPRGSSQRPGPVRPGGGAGAGGDAAAGQRRCPGQPKPPSLASSPDWGGLPPRYFYKRCIFHNLEIRELQIGVLLGALFSKTSEIGKSEKQGT